MKTQSFKFLAVAALLVLPQVSFAMPGEAITQIALQEQQKKALTEHLVDQADKYAGEGKYAGHGAWSLERIKADLKASLERTQKWVQSHLSFHFHATKAAAPAVAAPAVAVAAQAGAEVAQAGGGTSSAPAPTASAPEAAVVAKAEESHANNAAATQTYFETRKHAVDNFESPEQVIEAHQQAVQDVAKSDNYLFAVTNHAVAFDGTFIDSMVLILTVVTDFAFLPFEFLASLFTGF
jgi:hypothetical protein